MLHYRGTSPIRKVQGYLAHKKTPKPRNSYKRGTPVPLYQRIEYPTLLAVTGCSVRVFHISLALEDLLGRLLELVEAGADEELNDLLH